MMRRGSFDKIQTVDLHFHRLAGPGLTRFNSQPNYYNFFFFPITFFCALFLKWVLFVFSLRRIKMSACVYEQ